MNKNSKQIKHDGPGRPHYVVRWPRGKFTFTDLEIENGVNPKTGKGKNCTTLTLRKALKRELSNRRSGAVVHLKDTLADPNSKSGLGRKQYVYTRRTGVTASKASAPRKAAAAAAADVTVNVSQATQDYEAQKAALLAPIPVVTITPAPTPAPVAPEVTPEAAPVAADPAPTAEATPAPVAETAPVAEPVTA